MRSHRSCVLFSTSAPGDRRSLIVVIVLLMLVMILAEWVPTPRMRPGVLLGHAWRQVIRPDPVSFRDHHGGRVREHRGRLNNHRWRDDHHGRGHNFNRDGKTESDGEMQISRLCRNRMEQSSHRDPEAGHHAQGPEPAAHMVHGKTSFLLIAFPTPLVPSKGRAILREASKGGHQDRRTDTHAWTPTVVAWSAVSNERASACPFHSDTGLT